VSLELTLTASRLVPAPRARVWAAFARLSGLESWDPGGGAPPPVLIPLGLPVKVRPEAVEVEAPARAAWRARGLGIQVERELSFTEAAEGTVVESVEQLAGWMLALLRPWYSPKRLGRENQRWLRVLAQAAASG
jgi:uncharacterized protein YndB with AHSA1/START domain